MSGVLLSSSAPPPRFLFHLACMASRCHMKQAVWPGVARTVVTWLGRLRLQVQSAASPWSDY